MLRRSAVCVMSSDLLEDVGEVPAPGQLEQLKLATIEDQQWPADEPTLSKSGERGFVSTHLNTKSHNCTYRLPPDFH